MKIKLEHNEFKFELETPKHFGESFAHKAVSTFYRLISDTDSEMVIAEPIEPLRPTPIQTQSQIERPAFRDRLPNNLVDVKDLDIKQAITENALVRCPHCGQSHILAVNAGNRIYVMRKFYAYAAEDEFRIIFEFDSLTSKDFLGICCKPETNRKAYFDDVQKMPMIDDKDFAINNDTEVFCPVCCQSDTFMNWKKAFDEPLTFFETEHLCDACGGEKLEKLVKKTKMYQCDKCGLQTPFKET
jgi:predicted RNA-binding Zn-ribbon protein involved in translation (DUF1610 family)